MSNNLLKFYFPEKKNVHRGSPRLISARERFGGVFAEAPASNVFASRSPSLDRSRRSPDRAKGRSRRKEERPRTEEACLASVRFTKRPIK